MKIEAAGIVRRLQEAGHVAYFAGGCVRDELLGRPPKDYDVATAAMPEAVMALFPNTVPVGVQFGVVRVVTQAGDVEVATFRSDGPYRDGRHPDTVVFTDAEHDASRRDFTVNAMFFDPVTDRLLDSCGGRDDLARKVIRAVGDPRARFEEDRLRVLRAVRFAAELGFEMDPATASAVREFAPRLVEVAWERIRDEILKLLTGPGARRGLALMEATGLLSVALPEVAATKGVPQPPEFHPEGDVWVHTLMLFDHLQSPPPELALASLLHDIGKPPTLTVKERIRFDGHMEVGAEMARGVCERLRLSSDQTDIVTALVRDHLRFKDVRQMRESTLKRFLRIPHFDWHLELHRADCLACHGDLSNWEFCRDRLAEFARADAAEALRPRPLLRGEDLVALGYVPGPRFKEILTAVEDAQLERRVSTRDEAVTFVKGRFPC